MDRIKINSLGELGAKLLASFVALYALYTLASAVYNILFHPLRKIPGPWIAKVSPIWVAYCWTSGTYHQHVKKAHEKYGPAVRMAPNEVSFCSPSSWKEIYAHSGGRRPFMKSDWYSAVANEAPNLVSERNPDSHAAMRKHFSHGFSAQALAAQEEYVHGFVDIMIRQLHRNSLQTSTDIVRWYNYVTFDIIGELAFGQAFGSLEAGKMHFWVETVFQFIKTGSLFRATRWFPSLHGILLFLLRYQLIPKSIMEARTKQLQYSKAKLERRLYENPTKPDFLGKAIDVLRDEKTGTYAMIRQLVPQANILILAGSETTASALSAVTYFLGRNPVIYKEFTSEIRGTFKDYKEITSREVEKLTYIKAVIAEALRMFPPAPIGLPRVSPGEQVDGYYLSKGTVTYTSSWAASRSELNWHKAEEFIPERWLDGGFDDKKEASQPFLLGPRVCLGRNLAMLELRVILAKLYWVYDISLATPAERWDELARCYIVWEKPPLLVHITRREGIHVPPVDNSSGMA